MSPNPTTIQKGTSLKKALDLIRSCPFRHLPILDEAGGLAGIVTEKDLVYASPSSDLTLSVFETDYLLSKLSVDQIMKENVVTVAPELPIEEAARLMVDHRIGCLPVLENGKLIGIISDTDIFRVFVEGLGGGHPSLRVSVVIPERVGSLAKMLEAVAALGGNVHSLGTFWGPGPQDRIIALRVDGVKRDELQKALQDAGAQVTNVWEAESA